MLREKVCAVLGLARAGVPSAQFLASRGAQVIGYDQRPLDQLSLQARDLSNQGVELRTGDHRFRGLENCAMIVLSPGLKIHHEPLLSILAECELRGAEVIGELELAARHCPAPMIAVTGTKGKSTTTKLIHEMLLACGLKAVCAGNTGTPLIAELPHLTPDSWAVVEVSSFQLERAPTFKPRIAVLLNLLTDHLDYHPSLEQYWNTKLKIFARQGRGDTAIFNLDDERVRAVWDDRSRIIDQLFQNGAGHGFSSTYGGQGIEGRLGCWRSPFFSYSPDFVPVISLDDIPLRGQHNLANVAAALTVMCNVMGKKITRHREAIAQAIRHFEPLPHHLEIVDTISGVRFVNDSQATIPEATIYALEAFPAPVALICGGKAKQDNPDAFDELGRTIAGRASLLAVIGEAGPSIAQAARRAGLEEGKIVSAETLWVAVRKCFAQLPQGGTILLSPSCDSFDQFESFEQRGDAFKSEIKVLKN